MKHLAILPLLLCLFACSEQQKTTKYNMVWTAPNYENLDQIIAEANSEGYILHCLHMTAVADAPHYETFVHADQDRWVKKQTYCTIKKGDLLEVIDDGNEFFVVSVQRRTTIQ